jgi:uncharacterized membrane protein
MTASPPLADRKKLRLPFYTRPRLLIAIIAGIAVTLLVPRQLAVALRAVIGWDFGIVLYLALILRMAATATPKSMHRRAEFEDATRWVFLGLMAGAAWFSMFAVLGILHQAARNAGGNGLPVELTVLAGATILLSWIFAHTTFAVHYAHDYYADRAATRPPGLLFPGHEVDPDYWDFIYFSFVIGMTAQVADVQIATRFWRRLVLAHGVLAFLFNTVILALCINLLAGQL